jgi:hypothetical protein
MFRGLITFLGAIVFIAICWWLFIAFLDLFWNLLPWFIGVFVFLILLDWIVGPRYIWARPVVVASVGKNTAKPCKADFYLKNGKCVPVK